jgi:hypothetical protein
MFSEDQDLVAFDIDNAWDEQGTIKKWVADILQDVQSYTELSPTITPDGRNKGLRMVARSSSVPPEKVVAHPDNNGGELQIQRSGGYLTFTGACFGELKPIRISDQVKVWYEFAAEKSKKDNNNFNSPRSFNTNNNNSSHKGHPPQDDDELVKKYARMNPGFQALYDGDMSAYDNDHSRADQAYIAYVMKATHKDKNRCWRLFEKSGLYDRKKADSPSYRKRTMDYAENSGIENWDWSEDTGKEWVEKTHEAYVKKEKRSLLPDIEDAFRLCEEDVPEPPELIQGLLHKGSKMSLGGGSKSFKTWLLLHLGLSVAYGKQWLGFPVSVRSKVLVINLELQRAFIRKRIKDLILTLGIVQEPGWFDLWNLRGCAASHTTIVPKVIERIEKVGYGLIILDPIYKLYGDTDENSARDVASLLNSLERVAVETEAAVAFSAHFSKGNQSSKNAMDRVSGSGVFARDPDSILTCTQHEEEDCYTMEAVLRNFPPVDPFVVKWEWPQFVRDDLLDPSHLKPNTGRPATYTTTSLMNALGSGGMTTDAWKTAAGCSDTTFYRLKKQAEAEGKLRQDTGGRWWRSP